MAKAPTEEQQQLRRRARRRLVGAIALVTVVAVVLPWVLEHEPRPSDQQIAVQIPSRDASKFEPQAPPSAPVIEPKAASPDTEVALGQSRPGQTAEDGFRAEQDKVLAPPARPAAQSSQGKEKPKPAPESKKKAADKPDAAAEPKVGTQNRPYVVQVAALADADKAAEIQQALAAKGLKAYTEKIKTAAGEVTRVRVGPFPDRDAAERERGRMKSLGFDGNVAPR